MSVFVVSIDSHGEPPQLGGTAHAERGSIARVLARIASELGTGAVPTQAAPAAIAVRLMIDGTGVDVPLGSYYFGADAIAVVVAEQQAREAAVQAEAAAAASAAKTKSKAA